METAKEGVEGLYKVIVVRRLLAMDSAQRDVTGKFCRVLVPTGTYTLTRIPHPYDRKRPKAPRYWLVLDGTTHGAPEQEWQQCHDAGMVVLTLIEELVTTAT